MWGYYSENLSVSDIYVFETEDEAMKFVRLASNRNMEEYPNEPDMWPMLGEDEGMVFELLPVQTAEEAVAEWFGDDI